MGQLYIVATPIGNLGDITYRAIDVLKSCDLVVCEDTRVTKRLLDHYQIQANLFVMNAHNEGEKVFEVIDRLLSGATVALASDSGTPLVSDPGYLLVTLALKKGIQAIPVPGASAVIASLSASGLPTDNFLFLGFLPKKEGQKKKMLSALFEGMSALSQGKIKPTIVFYDSPQRLHDTLSVMQDVFGDISVTVAREITKMHEEFSRGTVDELMGTYSPGVKGEICVLFQLDSK